VSRWRVETRDAFDFDQQVTTAQPRRGKLDVRKVRTAPGEHIAHGGGMMRSRHVHADVLQTLQRVAPVSVDARCGDERGKVGERFVAS